MCCRWSMWKLMEIMVLHWNLICGKYLQLKEFWLRIYDLTIESQTQQFSQEDQVLQDAVTALSHKFWRSGHSKETGKCVYEWGRKGDTAFAFQSHSPFIVQLIHRVDKSRDWREDKQLIIAWWYRRLFKWNSHGDEYCFMMVRPKGCVFWPELGLRTCSCAVSWREPWSGSCEPRGDQWHR